MLYYILTTIAREGLDGDTATAPASADQQSLKIAEAGIHGGNTYAVEKEVCEYMLG